MASKPSSINTTKRSKPATEEVEAFLRALDHPFKREILALREILLGADPSISEGIKWNAPSFRTSEYFATFNLRAKDRVQIILHLGAKKRDNTAELALADPETLLEWLATDRAVAGFSDLEDIEVKTICFCTGYPPVDQARSAVRWVGASQRKYP